jgi:hypothetical protein
VDVVDTVVELGMKKLHVEVVPGEGEAVAWQGAKDAEGAAVADAWDVDAAEGVAAGEDDGVGRAVGVAVCVDAGGGCGEGEVGVGEADARETGVDGVEHGGVVNGVAADPKVLVGVAREEQTWGRGKDWSVGVDVASNAGGGL